MPDGAVLPSQWVVHSPVRIEAALMSMPLRDRVMTSAVELLLHARNADGGWAYGQGRKSRLEPTCWALWALEESHPDAADPAVLLRWPRKDGFPIDVPGAPANYAIGALAGLTLLTDASTAAHAQPIIARLVEARGIRTTPTPLIEQDHDLQAWSWVDGTASWVEPTAWALLLLKRARRMAPPAALERIQTGERMLVDRACKHGGWNYGNKRVFHQDLWAYVPTTALALLALQDRRHEPVVASALEQLRVDVQSERSVLALALSLIAFRVYGLAHGDLEAALLRRFDETPGDERAQSLMAVAVLCCALGAGSHPMTV